jgi:hypothetical protein
MRQRVPKTNTLTEQNTIFASGLGHRPKQEEKQSRNFGIFLLRQAS